MAIDRNHGLIVQLDLVVAINDCVAAVYTSLAAADAECLIVVSGGGVEPPLLQLLSKFRLCVYGGGCFCVWQQTSAESSVSTKGNYIGNHLEQNTRNSSADEAAKRADSECTEETAG